ncbi:hypothetical protein F5887DRAFT_964594 [Amanita rubescens]|nr:hypothetical protein F5887DRAFT_964594 [Amanita rubescens]
MYNLATLILSLVASVTAKSVFVINVGGNTSADATTVFQPPSVTGNMGDVVYFNFTQGNHTAIQSLFDAPCVPIYVTNYTMNGFDSGFRDAGDGATFSNLLITILDPSKPIWFFDRNTCSQGGVGVINPTSSQTLAEFQDKAATINGTGPIHSSSAQASATNSSASAANTHASNDASQPVALSLSVVLPLVVLALSL